MGTDPEVTGGNVAMMIPDSGTVNYGTPGDRPLRPCGRTEFCFKKHRYHPENEYVYILSYTPGKNVKGDGNSESPLPKGVRRVEFIS